VATPPAVRTAAACAVNADNPAAWESKIAANP
jgi:hypothetical protein